jgi:hypothetical protein
MNLLIKLLQLQLKIEKFFKCQTLELNESKLVSDASSYSPISNAIIKLF